MLEDFQYTVVHARSRDGEQVLREGNLAVMVLLHVTTGVEKGL